MNRRSSNKNRKSTILPGSHFPPPPPASRSFSQMRSDTASALRSQMTTGVLDESFYNGDNHLLELFETASEIMNSEPSVPPELIEDESEDNEQIDEEFLDFSFDEDSLPPIPDDILFNSFCPDRPDFSITKRRTVYETQVACVYKDPIIRNKMFSHLESLLAKDGPFRRDFLRLTDFERSSRSMTPLDFFFWNLEHDHGSDNFSFDRRKFITNNLYQTDVYFRNLVDFDERNVSVNPRLLSRSRFFFCPSSGGKTTFKENRLKKRLFYDVDDMVRDNYPEFQRCLKFCQDLQDFSLMNQFWKSTFHIMYPLLFDKILLFNHPNQIPFPYLTNFNVSVIMPTHLNYGDKYFNENFYTLMSYDFEVYDCKLKFLDYDQYFSYVRDTVFKFK
jgi:hypothetical protein